MSIALSGDRIREIHALLRCVCAGYASWHRVFPDMIHAASVNDFIRRNSSRDDAPDTNIRLKGLIFIVGDLMIRDR